MFDYRAAVVRVVDGDTVDLDFDLGFRLTSRQRCRLLGIDAPERTTPEGERATLHLRELLPVGQVVRAQTERPDPRDKYGRFLADLFTGDGSVSGRMISAGHAKPYDGGKRG